MAEGFTNQLRREATDADLAAKWGGAPSGSRFRCYLCGHKFNVGDGWRWIYSGGAGYEINGERIGVCNPIVCDTCDGPDAMDRWVARNREFSSERFWALHPYG